MRASSKNLSRPVTRAASGEEVLIAKKGKPMTLLSDRKSASLIGAFANKVHMADDFDAIPTEFEPACEP